MPPTPSFVCRVESLVALIVALSLVTALPAAVPAAATAPRSSAVQATGSAGRATVPPPPPPWWAPGREADARVAAIALRIATAGRARCTAPMTGTGLVLQHLSDFTPADRPTMIAALSLDRGPAVIAVVPDSPASTAGMRVGDVLLAADGSPLPPDADAATPFDQARARARADAVDDLLADPAGGPVTLTLLREGTPIMVRVVSRPICPSRVRLARSGQRNAYADGHHVLVTTGLVSRLRSDDELAFVLAHEMAHNILGHAALLRAGTGAGGDAARAARGIVRATERDADALAGELLIDAGYDPVVGAEALRRLGGSGFALFPDHAPDGERIAAMRALVEARRSR